MLRKAVVGVAAILIAAGCSSGHPTARPSPPTTVRLSSAEVMSRDAAAALTGRMLDAVILPSDARLATDHGLPATLHAPLERFGVRNLVQAHRVWKLHGDPRTVARFVNVHLPRGYASRSTGTSTLGPGRSGHVWQQDDQPLVMPSNVSNADIDISIAATSGSAMLLRADAVVGWTAPRPASEFVPAKDRVVTVSVVRNYEHGRIGKRVVTADPKLVEPIVFAFNASRVDAPPTEHTSPPGGRRSVTYRVAFASSARARPDIVAEIGLYEYGLGVRVNGGRSPALVDSGFSISVAHVLGLSEPHWG